MQYEFVMKPNSVTVITPTLCSEKLFDAIESVKQQTYDHITHLIVIDGPTSSRSKSRLYDLQSDKLKIIDLPENTGGGATGFYGHRIYSGVPHLVNSDRVFFLDDDNWYENDHVESLVNVLNKVPMAFSFRQIYDENKYYICDDNCESLGKWPIYFTHDNPQYLIDTSSFAFRTDFLISVAHLWHSGWGGDRRFLSSVKDIPHETNYKHSLCYRLDGNQNSVKEDFFLKGNEQQLNHYKGNLPWIK